MKLIVCEYCAVKNNFVNGRERVRCNWSYGLGLGLGLEPCGLVNITVCRTTSALSRTTSPLGRA